MAFSLNDYDILGELGCGGFGTVYRARQKSLDRIVAIKCLSPHRTQNSNEIVRFRREAQAMATLSHDNIIAVYDHAYSSGSYYIVMEYVDGLTYDQAMKKQISIELSLYIMEKVVAALLCAHEQEIIHRDLKPANIFLGKNGQVRLADFGLALFQQEMTSQSINNAIGTLAYMAPEVMVSPGEIDYRADIFALGCMIYEAFSGKLPFPGSSIAEVSYNVLNKEPLPLIIDKRYSDIVNVTLRCICKDRDQRPSLSQIGETIRKCLGDSYSTIQLKLSNFVRGESNAKESSSFATDSISKTKLAIKKKINPVYLIGTSVLILIAFSTVCFIINQKASLKNSVPSLQTIEQASHIQQRPVEHSLHNQAPVTDDGPKPLTSDEENRAGTLKIKGAVEGDIILINNKAFDTLKDNSEKLIAVNSGHYQITVQCKSGKLYTKEIEIMPFQIIEWYLK